MWEENTFCGVEHVNSCYQDDLGQQMTCIGRDAEGIEGTHYWRIFMESQTDVYLFSPNSRRRKR